MLRNVRRRYPSRGKDFKKGKKKKIEGKKKKKKRALQIITKGKRVGKRGGDEIERILVFACKLCFNCQSYRLSATRVNENSSIKRKYNTGCFKERV